jgi:Fur family transcriptional regulator, ferric uptake regulator
MNYQSKTLRLSRGSQLILGVLQKTKGLYSARQIYDVLRAELKASAPGMTTIYRSLETLQRLQLIQAAGFGQGEKNFEAVHPGEHYHHLTCTNCRASLHIDTSLVENMRSKIQKQHNFEVRMQILELFGVCVNCRGSSLK